MGHKSIWCFFFVAVAAIFCLNAETPQFELTEVSADVAADGTMLPDSIWNTSDVGLDTHAISLTPDHYVSSGVAIGKYFKGTGDDTIRVAAIYTRSYSGEILELVILTDTTTTTFGQSYYRREVAYTYDDYSECPIALGDIDGDDFTDIVFRRPSSVWNNKVIMWIEWDTVTGAWAAQDSVTITNKDIRDIVIGDADNDGIPNEILCATYRWNIVRAVWTESGWDTLTIGLDSLNTCGVAIGDARPDISGNEIYVAGHDYPASRVYMVWWTGSAWESEEISDCVWPSSNEIEEAKDIDVGDLDPLLPGNEVAVTHTHGGGSMPYSMHYQISLYNWSDSAWQSRAWHWPDHYGLGGIYITIGDVIPENPGSEAIVTQDYVHGESKIFWLAPNGSAFMRGFYYPTYSTYVAIGDVDKFRDIGYEFVLSGDDGLIAVEAHDYANDIGTYYYRMHNQTSVKNSPDTIQAVIFNAGSQPQSGFTVGYCFENSMLQGSGTYANTLEPNDTGYVEFPITFDFLGFDTLYVYTDLAGDAYSSNDTVPLHIEVYDDSTQAASGFNHRIFPPVTGTTEPYDWQAIILSEDRYQVNWYRHPHPQYPEGPTLEGYAGARSECYGKPAFRVARLRTHKFNTGDAPRRVFCTFYNFYAPWQGSVYGCSLYVGYSYDDSTYNTIWSIQDWEAAREGWKRYEIELGDFPAHTDLYVGITSSTGGGGTDWFIDSVRVWDAFPTRHDAGAIHANATTRPVVQNDTFGVMMMLKNYGSDYLTSTPVFYTFGDADTVWETWNGSLEHNDTAQYFFVTPCTRSEAAWETLYVGTRFAGDEKAGNDVFSRPFEICDSVLLPPYTKDFNEEWEHSLEPPFDGWKIVNGGTSPPTIDGNDWHRDADSTYEPPRTLACIRWQPAETHDDWLISPRFDCTSEGEYTLSYWHYYRDWTPARPDSGRALVSTDDGTTWTTVAVYSNYCYPGVHESFDITDIVQGQAQVKIAFHYVATEEEYWHIDDFALDYHLDSIPPAAVVVTQTEKSGDDVVLTWNQVLVDTLGDSETVDYYVVYRSSMPDYVPQGGDSIGAVAYPETTFKDVGALNSLPEFYYLVKAVDDRNNRSAKSNMGYKFNKQVNENAGTTDKNWVSLPWFSNYATVSDLTDDLSPAGDPLTKVTRLDDAQLYYSWMWDDVFLEWTGSDFTIIPGEGYEMIAAQDTSIVLVGCNDPDGHVTLNENAAATDKDWVSIPYNAVYSTAADITDEYSPAGDPLIKLTRMRDDQLYESWFWDVDFSEWVGVDFAIEPGTGYEFITIIDTTWNPTEFANSGSKRGPFGVCGSDIAIHNGSSVSSNRVPLWRMANGQWQIAKSQEPRAKRIAQRAESQEQRAKSQEPRAKGIAQRAESQEQRVKNQEPRVKNQERRAEGIAHRAQGREQSVERRAVSHVVRGHLVIEGCEDVVFTAYRLQQPHDVLTENMVGSGRVVRDGRAAIWFDVGNFATGWQDGEELLVMIEAIADGEAYFTVVKARLDGSVDIQELDISELMRFPEFACTDGDVHWSTIDNEHVIGYAVYDGDTRVNDRLITAGQCCAGHDIIIKPVITGGHETVFGLSGAQGRPDVSIAQTYAFSLAPNPFSELTTISFDIEHSAQSIELTIYDVSGRLVKSFDNLPQASGPVQIRWSGDDDHGRGVPAGVYFVHFSADDHCTINKAILLR